MENGHKILDIGCGNVKVPSAVGLDNVDLANVDVVHDILDFPYPFDERYFDAIYLKHVIEHFSIMKIDEIQWNLNKFNEIWWNLMRFSEM